MAMGLSSLLLGMIVQTLLLHSDKYLEDLSRIRVTQNLRAAMDIISMNVRQAGEEMDPIFPAVEVNSGVGTLPDTLVLRRSPDPTTLRVCDDISSTDSRIYVSEGGSGDAECLPVNVATNLSRLSNLRTSGGGSIRIYVYDRVAKIGQFVDYTGEASAAGDDYLMVSGLTADYSAGSSSVYIVEELAFQLNIIDDKLTMVRDGNIAVVEDVAYDIQDFQVSIELQDGTNITALNSSSIQTWKDIKLIKIDLSGQESWKKRVFDRTISGEFFPRNVLSS